MKTKLSNLLFLLGPIAFLSLPLGCKKAEKAVNSALDQATTVSLAVSSSVSESIYGDLFNVVTLEGENNNIAGREHSPAHELTCATVTLSPADPNVFPKTMTIDFGSAGCTTNGITRKGKLIVTASGKIRNNGTVLNISFENYSINGYKVEGDLQITNNSTANGLSFTTQTNNGKVTFPDGTYYMHTGSHTLTQTEGNTTPTFTDDAYSISGGGTTTSSTGNKLTVTIVTPLVRSASCRNIVSGVENFTYNTTSGSVNFGDGTCDNLAILTIGNTSTTITLPN